MDFSLVSKTLTNFIISNNQSLDDISFLNALFKKAIKLEKLGMSNINLSIELTEKVDFALIPKSVTEINFSYNKIDSPTYLNTIFAGLPKLSILSLFNTELDQSTFK